MSSSFTTKPTEKALSDELSDVRIDQGIEDAEELLTDYAEDPELVLEDDARAAEVKLRKFRAVQAVRNARRGKKPLSGEILAMIEAALVGLDQAY